MDSAEDAELVKRHLGDRFPAHQGRNRNPHDPLGDDPTLAATGGARQASHAAASTALEARLDARHRDRPSTPRGASSGVRMTSTVGPSGPSVFGSPMPVKFRNTRSSRASKDGRTANGSPGNHTGSCAMVGSGGQQIARAHALATRLVPRRGGAVLAGRRGRRTPRPPSGRRQYSARRPRPGEESARDRDTAPVFPAGLADWDTPRIR